VKQAEISTKHNFLQLQNDRQKKIDIASTLIAI